MTSPRGRATAGWNGRGEDGVGRLQPEFTDFIGAIRRSLAEKRPIEVAP
jgi:hypothetical protein